MKNIVVDGVEYRPVKQDGERLSIIIADNRGLAFIGWVDWSGDGERIVVRDARCIIRWGTKKHIAELISGPSENTRLGLSATVYLRRSQIICDYEVKDVGAWT